MKGESLQTQPVTLPKGCHSDTRLLILLLRFVGAHCSSFFFSICMFLISLVTLKLPLSWFTQERACIPQETMSAAKALVLAV